MDSVRWKDGMHNWWNATRIGGDLVSSFKINNIQQGSILTIVHENAKSNIIETGSHVINSQTPSTLQDWENIADELNASTHPIISKFNYNPVFEDTNNDGNNDTFLFILAVGKGYSRTYDFKEVELTNGNIYGKVNYVNYNPTADTVRIINGCAEVERSTHITFSLDKTEMAGIKRPVWKIYKDSSQEEHDIYYDNMWLTYIFKEAGSYRISAEVEDTNGNTNIVERNMIIVK
jgi:hypothetical protein